MYVFENFKTMYSFLKSKVLQLLTLENSLIIAIIYQWDEDLTFSICRKSVSTSESCGIWRFQVLGNEVRDQVLYSFETAYEAICEGRQLHSVVYFRDRYLFTPLGGIKP